MIPDFSNLGGKNEKPSNVKEHKYDPENKELIVTFSHGPTSYKYFDITQSQADELASAKSKGAWLHANIIGINDHRKLDD